MPIQPPEPPNDCSLRRPGHPRRRRHHHRHRGVRAEPPHNEQVALVDLTGEQLELKSATSGTGQTTTHDGLTVVFATEAPLVPWDDNGESDVYMRHLYDDVTILVSGVDGKPGNDISNEPTISADGRYVTFTCSCPAGTRLSFSPVISDDGRSVAFQTFGSFGQRDDDNREDVYVRDLESGKTRQGSLLPATNRDVRGPVLVGDLSNLVAGDAFDQREVFVWRGAPPNDSD
jgi:Tol biopolymer transport system component